MRIKLNLRQAIQPDIPTKETSWVDDCSRWIKKITENVLLHSDLLLLPSQIEEKYWLLVAEQHIFPIDEYSNNEEKFTKKEFLLRDKKNTWIDKLLWHIEENGDSFWLFCFMLKKAYEEKSIGPSINIWINVVLDPRFRDVITLFKEQYWNSNTHKITLEILEDIDTLTDILTKSIFDKNLQYASDKWFAIVSDDFWTGFSDIKRNETLQQNENLDWIKLDRKLVMSLFIY